MTLQKRDILSYQGKKYALNCDIWKAYFEARPEKKPEKIGFDSNLHRGYFSEFEIIDNQLRALDLWVNMDVDRDSGAYISQSILDDTLSPSKVCHWYSGSLILFSISGDIREEREYLRLKISDGMLLQSEKLSKAEYDDLGNHAYDYF